MNRLTRYFLIGGGVVIITAVIIGFFLRFQLNNNAGSNPFKFTPNNTEVIIKINQTDLFSEIANNEYNIVSHIFELAADTSLINKLQQFDSFLIKSGLHNQLNNTSHYLNIRSTNSGKVSWTLNLFIPEKQIELFMLEAYKIFWSNTTVPKLNSRKYEGYIIYQVSDVNSNKSLFYCNVKTHLLMGNSSLYIEDAIRQSKLQNTLEQNKYFTEIYRTAGKSKSLNVFINCINFEKTLSLVSNSNAQEFLKRESTFGIWCELDVNIKNDLLLLNGFVSSSDSLQNFIRLVENSNPVKLTCDEILPSGLGSFLVFGNDDFTRFYKNYYNFIEAEPNSHYLKQNRRLNEKLNLNVTNRFLQVIDNEIGIAFQDFGSNDKTANYVFLKCLSKDKTTELLLQLFEAYNLDIKDYTFNYEVDNDLTYPIYHLPEKYFCKKVFGEIFGSVDDTYITIYNNYLIFGNSYNNLSSLIYQNVLKKTLVTDPNYQSFKNNLSSKSFCVFYNNLSRTNLLVSKVLNDNIIESWENNRLNFQHIPAMGLQISEVGNSPYCNFNWVYSKQNFSKPKTIWESLLDTVIDFKPQFVVNHNTQEKEIFVQDEMNQIYLISRSGRILWKQQLDEKINSEVYQIDFYKNKKLQFLFSTKSSLHLIDRNGNYVERYPIKLRSKASAGLALFDYDKNKNYRIVIPTSDKRVYMYSKDGNIVSGWQFKETEHQLKLSPQHFRIYDKDFIVFGDKYHHYILDRKGSVRVELEKHIPKSDNGHYELFDAGNLQNSYFVTSDTSGAIIKMYINGKVEKQQLDNQSFSKTHSVQYNDINADGHFDYVFLDEGELSVITHQGKKVFTYKSQKKFIKKPVIYTFSYSDKKIGLLTSKPSEIHLVNSDGKLYKGFPLEGNTLFSIGYFDFTSSSFNLIVGGRNNFLYNYNVE